MGLELINLISKYIKRVYTISRYKYLEDFMRYICRCCGHMSSAASSGNCSKSETGSHDYMEECDDGYICSGCGHKSSAASGGSCSKTASGYHYYIGQHSGSYVCRYCGHSSSAASGGSCRKSPTGYHFYM